MPSTHHFTIKDVCQVIENSLGTLLDILIYLLLSYTHIKNSEPQNIPKFPFITLQMTIIEPSLITKYVGT